MTRSSSHRFLDEIIIYEDNHLLVVNKPVNVPVQSDESGDIDLQTKLKEYLARKYDKKGNVFLGIVHRLDRPVGGVMVFARTSKAASRLSDQVRTRTIRKEYVAVVHGSVAKVFAPGTSEVTLRHWLEKDQKTNMVSAYNHRRGSAKEAILHFSIISESGGLSLLKIRLETGRPHQIRVQLRAAGFPVWGDQRYNVSAVPGEQIALFARNLIFQHPVKGDQVEFSANPPKSEPWVQFG